MGQLHPPRLSQGQWIVDAWSQAGSSEFRNACNVLTTTLEPTRLDRTRVERICALAISQEWVDHLGEKQLIFRGRGGTGKTTILLQLAWRVFINEDARVLILTYNRALASDLRRLMALIGVPDDIGQRSIQVQTVHSFIYSLLDALDLISEGVDFLRGYESLKRELLSYIESGAITPSDLESLVVQKAERFGWDYLFIDEGQDWPVDERDLLRKLYRPETFVIADGIDQYVRREVPTDWRQGLLHSKVKVVGLVRALRMKAGLARFATRFAAAIGLSNWEAVPNPESPGGRVTVIEGDYSAHKSLHERLVRENVADGNQPVDMLTCVPPEMVIRYDGTSRSVAADLYTEWGQDVWDGASEDVRASYPTSVRQLRIVQYESCRGLEGWTTVNLGLDSFYEHKLITASSGGFGAEYADDPQLAHREAARWVMIPLTRAIDTLVVQVSAQPSIVRDALRETADAYEDLVEWYD